MFNITLYSLMITMNFLFMQMNHPLAMGLILMTQTILVCLLTGLISKTFWFSYILFLIFLGGMLVLFIYVTSLASNEMFSMSIKLMMTMLILLSFIMIILFLFNNNDIYNFMFNNEIKKIDMNLSFIKESSISLNKLYNFPTNLITLMLINYLLITLIATVKITKFFYGPLRLMY
nr:NADH dehydrogenase subunit 6 [Cephalops aeneus]